MGRFATAARAFFRSLLDAATAEQVERALNGNLTPALPEPSPATNPIPVSLPPTKPARSDALTLLSTLQREARFVDFFQEKLDSYSDAQIGAAVRDVHRDTSAVLQRLFALHPVSDASEGSQVPVPSRADAGKFRLTGNVTDQPIGNGILRHAGWEATRCDLPIWSGQESAARIIAPAEIEVT